MDKIKALDVIYEQIVLDTILNSPKFIFSQTYGNVQSLMEDAVRTLVTKNYIFKSGGDNNEQNENINMTSSNFKGKNLTDIYDWNVNEIFKRCGIHIPSQKKSAQQSVPESTAVNISTINYIEQKLWQFNIDILKFIQILVNLTDIYDWNVNEIFKRCGIHIPSQKKFAQQSVPESTAVNISTINISLNH
ncbi:MAG: hypothetical protein H9Q67_07280 [Spiroplasma ixodetis]|nr:hypothetical protein [Spiroplasma ixodetis]